MSFSGNGQLVEGLWIFPSEFRNPIMEAGHSTTLLKINYDGKDG